MSNKTVNIMICGVGGQGSLLASRILGKVAMLQGYDVKVSELHGMSQRGGSVVTYVKYGEEVYAPVICKGEADYLLSFELLEAARWLPYVKRGGTIIANSQKIKPMPVVMGAMPYPENLEDKIAAADVDFVCTDALKIAEECGSSKAVNIVLIGMLAKRSSVDKSIFIEALKSTVPEKFLDLNMKAFEAGYNI